MKIVANLVLLNSRIDLATNESICSKDYALVAMLDEELSPGKDIGYMGYFRDYSHYLSI
jgi:hypothetical protein